MAKKKQNTIQKQAKSTTKKKTDAKKVKTTTSAPTANTKRSQKSKKNGKAATKATKPSAKKTNGTKAKAKKQKNNSKPKPQSKNNNKPKPSKPSKNDKQNPSKSKSKKSNVKKKANASVAKNVGKKKTTKSLNTAKSASKGAKSAKSKSKQNGKKNVQKQLPKNAENTKNSKTKTPPKKRKLTAPKNSKPIQNKTVPPPKRPIKSQAKSKPTKAPTKTISDRQSIQQHKDLETAKKRLQKRHSSKSNTTETVKAQHEPHRQPATPHKKDINESDIWKDYIVRFGSEPQNPSQIQSFTKTNAKYQTLNYKDAKKIYDTFCHATETSVATKEKRTENYIKRDITLAKKRLSQTLNSKQFKEITKIEATTKNEENSGSISDDDDAKLEEIVAMHVIDDVDAGDDNGTESETHEESEDENDEDEDGETESNESGNDSSADDNESDDENENSDDDDEDEKTDIIPPVPRRPTNSVTAQFRRSVNRENGNSTTAPPLPQRKTVHFIPKTQNGTKPQLPRRQTTVEHIKRESNASHSMKELQRFVESEQNYVKKGLRICFETFLNRLHIHNQAQDTILSDEDIQLIFSNYANIYTINQKLFDDIMAIRLNEGAWALRDSLGSIMMAFSPYFKMYTDYIVRKRSALTRLEELKKSNQKFHKFLKINETCVKRKLKSFLEEPVQRLPQYLQYLGNIYESYRSESQMHNQGQQSLLESIVDIKNVSDEIATKCRDLKSRLLIGTLQRDLFGNKVQLLSAHRYCITHDTIHMFLHNYKDRKIKTYNIILCNDILLISTMPSKFKSSNLISVHPLLGMRISLDPVITAEKQDLLDPVNQFKFSILPAGHTLILESNDQMNAWMAMIEEAVDVQEHSLQQCNIVDLEKRIRKQKTSKHGESETVTVTNQERIKRIEAWKQKQYDKQMQSRTHLKTRAMSDVNHVESDGSMVGATPPPLPERKAKSIDGSAQSQIEQNGVSEMSPRASNAIPRPPPRAVRTRPPKLPPRRQTVDAAMYSATKAKTESVQEEKKGNDAEAPKKNPMRMNSNLLSGITSFKAGNLKHIDNDRAQIAAAAESGNMTDILQSTLKNYRQFVMDDDDDADESDDEWVV